MGTSSRWLGRLLLLVWWSHGCPHADDRCAPTEELYISLSLYFSKNISDAAAIEWRATQSYFKNEDSLGVLIQVSKIC